MGASTKYFSKAVLTVISAGLMATSIGCGKSGGSDGSGGGGAPIYGTSGPGYGGNPTGGVPCGNCGAAQTYVVSALGQGGTGFLEVAVDVFMAVGNPGGVYGGGDLMSLMQNYQGPIGASGELHVASDFSSCHIDPGTYIIQTAQPGQYMGFSQFSGLVLQGHNQMTGLPVTLVFNAGGNNYLSYLTGVSYSANNVPYNFKLQKTMTIVQAGPMNCSGGSYELF